MRHLLLICFCCLLLTVSVQAQTPTPSFAPQAAPAAPLDTLVVALVGFAVVVLTAAGGFIGAVFKRRTDAEATKVLVNTKAAETKAEMDTKAAAIKVDLEAQAAEDRKQVRELFKEKVDELKQELKDLRESTKLEIDGLRKAVSEAKLEASEARTETKTQTEITSTLQAENAQLRKDVDHMPQEIARLEALLIKKGNGDGQGASKSVLDDASQARVDAAKDDAP